MYTYTCISSRGYIYSYISHSWVLSSLHEFIWSCHRQPYIKFLCIDQYIYTFHWVLALHVENVYMSLNAPLILETLQYWWFLKQNAILNTVYIAGPYSVFVKLNLAYHLAICELFFLLFSTFMSDYDFYVVFCLHPKVFASQIKISWL